MVFGSVGGYFGDMNGSWEILGIGKSPARGSAWTRDARKVLKADELIRFNVHILRIPIYQFFALATILPRSLKFPHNCVRFLASRSNGLY